jgi:hypothetical protein
MFCKGIKMQVSVRETKRQRNREKSVREKSETETESVREWERETGKQRT